jgi:hypothetical protein
MSSGGYGDQYGQPAPYGGQQQQVSPYGRPGRPTNSLAIAAMSCGIAQLIAGPIATIPALICGFIALGQIQRTGEDGRGMAVSGIVSGFVGLILEVLVVVLLIKYL